MARHESAAATVISTHQVIMFVDVVGSTALYEKLGDVTARRLIATVLARLTELITAKNGRVAAELGDELMCFFSYPADAAAAACDMHARIGDEFKLPTTGARMRLRIGLHFGSVQGHKDDLMSETAKIAHWAASNAKPDQTLATLSVIDSLPRIFRAVSRYVDDETWNFVSFEHVALYEIIWDVEAITAAVAESVITAPQRYSAVIFSLEGDTLSLSAERPVISVGRGSQNDLVVQQDLISRQHFTAQFSRGRCTITDKSTNGTCVIEDHGSPQIVRRETYPLSGSGMIVLGNPEQPTPSAAIRYECR